MWSLSAEDDDVMIWLIMLVVLLPTSASAGACNQLLTVMLLGRFIDSTIVLGRGLPFGDAA